MASATSGVHVLHIYAISEVLHTCLHIFLRVFLHIFCICFACIFLHTSILHISLRYFRIYCIYSSDISAYIAYIPPILLAPIFIRFSVSRTGVRLHTCFANHAFIHNSTNYSRKQRQDRRRPGAVKAAAMEPAPICQRRRHWGRRRMARAGADSHHEAPAPIRRRCRCFQSRYQRRQ